MFPFATLWVAKLVRPKFTPTPEKVMPYECGITPESDARGRYTVRFYIIAILFVIFDVETIFLFPASSRCWYFSASCWSVTFGCGSAARWNGSSLFLGNPKT